MTIKPAPFQKMTVSLKDTVIYSLQLGSHSLDLNEMIGHTINLHFSGDIICMKCKKKTKKSFFQGFCYRCFISAPEAADCILRPELCKGHEGIGRDLAWEEAHHVKPHTVYISQTSDLKVGVTRSNQKITRWIDQGAVQALVLAETPNRYVAGCIEVALKGYISDKTQWRNMLKPIDLREDLAEVKSKLAAYLSEDLKPYVISDNTIIKVTYPIQGYPEKIKSLTFDKQPIIQEKLIGIKGQYLLFEENKVFNVRRHTGYVATLSL